MAKNKNEVGDEFSNEALTEQARQDEQEFLDKNRTGSEGTESSNSQSPVDNPTANYDAVVANKMRQEFGVENPQTNEEAAPARVDGGEPHKTFTAVDLDENGRVPQVKDFVHLTTAAHGASYGPNPRVQYGYNAPVAELIDPVETDGIPNKTDFLRRQGAVLDPNLNTNSEVFNSGQLVFTLDADRQAKDAVAQVQEAAQTALKTSIEASATV